MQVRIKYKIIKEKKARLESLLLAGGRTRIAGILNVTPDSFSDGGRFMDPEKAARRAKQLAKEGADLIDIGGESTRPGSAPIGAREEMARVLPVIERVNRELDIPMSIDTSKANVAEAAVKSGASIINDVTGLKGDPEMAGVAARYNAIIVLMHMKGAPRNMQDNPQYDNLIEDICQGLRESMAIAGRAGVDEKNIIVDPGIGFGKTLEHNLTIIRELGRFKGLGKPIMVGPSRKSFIGRVLQCGTDERLMGTAAAVAVSVLNGADIVRVHDVKEMKDVATLADSICRC